VPLKAFQRNYWLNSDTVVAPVRVSQGGYPGWQVTVIASLFGAIGDQIRAALQKWRWVWSLVRRIRGLDRDRQLVILRTLDLVEHQNYPLAQSAVKQTATTLGFNRPEAWKPLSHALKRDAGRAENTFRHLNTVELLQIASRAAGSTLTNPELHFLSELAYQSYAIRGR
jgi:hypothetical protein